ncbi:hypothetical protein ACWF94_05745 [Streptomyces sp. NPDC055078]
MKPRKPRPSATLGAAVAAALLTAGCQSGSGGGTSPAANAPATSPPHGYVEGAEETAEQQARLVLADAASGATRVLDLVTGDTTALKGTEPIRGAVTDGRFAFLATATGTRVVDSGTWTVDHGDHVHHYRAKVRGIGPIPGQRASHIHSDPAVTAVSFADGSARLYDRTALADGTVGAGRPLPGAARPGPVVPYREHLVVPGRGSGRDTVQITGREGTRPVTSIGARCAQPGGAAVTRRGVVLACSDGALLITGKNGRFTGLKIPYGKAVAARDRARSFDHRPGGSTLAARAGDDGAWLLDTTKRAWTHIRTGPVVAATTAGEGTPLLALAPDGVLSAYDPATGRRTATTKVLPRPGGTPAVIEIDAGRAYINDASAKRVHEIDYNDGLRRARTFPLDIAPTHMVETGR